ncbi:GH32 C-terminal domain-containing protein, partial [Providencia stuartii]|nr:GH32 C-terminal domain-containing protein [Providencia stuartii]
QFFIDGQTQQLTLSRHYPEHIISDYRSAPLPQTRYLTIRAFIDRSSLEVFINEGEMCFTSRIYPQEGERALTLFTINQSAKLIKGTLWPLKGVAE